MLLNGSYVVVVYVLVVVVVVVVVFTALKDRVLKSGVETKIIIIIIIINNNNTTNTTGANYTTIHYVHYTITYCATSML